MVKPREQIVQPEQLAKRRRLAAVIRQRCPHSDFNVDDWQQELVLQLLEAEPSFDPNQGDWAAYAYAISTRYVARTIHDLRPGPPYQEPIDDQALLTEHRELAAWEMACDVQEALRELPPELRQLASLLMRVRLSDAARELGLARSTLQRRVRRLRAALRHLQPDDSPAVQ